MAPDIDRWISALQTRHRAAFTTPEFLKAVRALSARYVERRQTLPDRSPLDSAAKRAAFAAFYSPLHFLTVERVIDGLGAARANLTSIVDLGCGTGVSSAAWARACQMRPRITGIDRHAWALDEAVWTWRTLGLDGHIRRADLVRARADPAAGLIAGWSVNELDQLGRRELRARLLEMAARGTAILVIEPIGRRATPWWADWAEAWTARGGRADEWRFDDPLPPVLAELDEAAGFRREGLTAKTLWLAP